MTLLRADRVPVIDLFAGPGGLNEGFSAVQDETAGGLFFDTKASFEMDPVACQTLRVRATYRRLRESGSLSTYYDFTGHGDLADWVSDPSVADHWAEAQDEVFQHELGAENRAVSDAVISELVGPDQPWVLVGGPPCQAYSLAGRSRRANDATWATDHKHVLYREYLHILERFQPAIFVMENVKGMLSSQYGGGPIFNRIVEDLVSAGPGYELRSFQTGTEAETPADYIVRSEAYGVPQARHRVLILGVRKDWADAVSKPLDPIQNGPTVAQTIKLMPRVRSRVTPFRDDSDRLWGTIREHARTVEGHGGGIRTVPSAGSRFVPGTASIGDDLPEGLADWLLNPDMPGLMDHVAKGHRMDDLLRYHYYASESLKGRTLRLQDLPADMLPDHKNAGRNANGVTPFSDRFRVQRWDRPSNTIVSHIAKDGHYFIHPDPDQMRSLTVREAARLQTFPDDYWFSGPPSRQYHQVGNAVPPWLAHQLGQIVRDTMLDRPGGF